MSNFFFSISQAQHRLHSRSLSLLLQLISLILATRSLLLEQERTLHQHLSTSSAKQPVLVPLHRYSRLCTYSARDTALQAPRPFPTSAPSTSNPLAPVFSAHCTTPQICLGPSLPDRPTVTRVSRREARRPSKVSSVRPLLTASLWMLNLVRMVHGSL